MQSDMLMEISQELVQGSLRLMGAPVPPLPGVPAGVPPGGPH